VPGTSAHDKLLQLVWNSLYSLFSAVFPSKESERVAQAAEVARKFKANKAQLLEKARNAGNDKDSNEVSGFIERVMEASFMPQPEDWGHKTNLLRSNEMGQELRRISANQLKCVLLVVLSGVTAVVIAQTKSTRELAIDVGRGIYTDQQTMKYYLAEGKVTDPSSKIRCEAYEKQGDKLLDMVVEEITQGDKTGTYSRAEGADIYYRMAIRDGNRNDLALRSWGTKFCNIDWNNVPK
jgi:hypothetical protein